VHENLRALGAACVCIIGLRYVDNIVLQMYASHNVRLSVSALICFALLLIDCRMCIAHTPDNSFLGFIVPKTKLITVMKKENYALIIGKEPRYLIVCCVGFIVVISVLTDYASPLKSYGFTCVSLTYQSQFLLQQHVF